MAPPLILVVDDNPPLRYALGRTLRQHGFDVVEAATGEDALKLSATEHPDLVLLDVNLPDMDGTTVLREIRTDPALADLAVIGLSADATQDQVQRLIQAGADDYVTKPVDFDILLEAIRRLSAAREPRMEECR